MHRHPKRQTKPLVSGLYSFIYSSNLTQAQLDLQDQLEPTTTDLITQPLFNNSPDLFLEAMDQDQPKTNSEQIELFFRKNARLLE